MKEISQEELDSLLATIAEESKRANTYWLREGTELSLALLLEMKSYSTTLFPRNFELFPFPVNTTGCSDKGPLLIQDEKADVVYSIMRGMYKITLEAFRPLIQVDAFFHEEMAMLYLHCKRYRMTDYAEVMASHDKTIAPEVQRERLAYSQEVLINKFKAEQRKRGAKREPELSLENGRVLKR